MPHPRVTLSPTEAETPEGVVAALRARFEAVREELGLSLDYPVEARREAEAVAAAPMDLPTNDQTGLAFFTLDPAGSMDLDQAMHLERDGDGHRVRYAIADVPAFVRLGGALDHETRERGQTVYCPDVRVPLHPEVISEGAASLLPGVVRPAFVWDLHLDGTGELVSSSVERAMVPAQRSSGRSYFITTLLRSVVFPEQRLAGADLKLERRRHSLRFAAVSAMALFTLVLLAGWAYSTWRNLEYLKAVEAKVEPLQKTLIALPAHVLAERAWDALRATPEFVDHVLQVIVGLADRRRVEGVGFNEVRTGFQISIMHSADDVGPGQRE